MKSNLLEGLQRRKALLEETFSYLHTNSSDPHKGDSKNIIVRYSGIYQDPKTKQAITTWTADSASGKGKYNVEIGLSLPQGTLFTFASTKNKLGDKVKTLANADVRVYCSCPYFYWWGPKFNTGPNGNLSKNSGIPKSNGYKYEKDVVSYAPDKRDPGRTHLLCKHLDSVFKHFSANALEIMRDAKNANVVTPVEPKEETVGKEPVGLDKNKPEQEGLRKGLMENFSTKVDELYKNKELTDDESKDMVDTVMPTDEDTEEPIAEEPVNQPDQLKERPVEDVNEILNSAEETLPEEQEEPEEENPEHPVEPVIGNAQSQTPQIKPLEKDRHKTINPKGIIT